ncbi:MAG: hypothetical protein WBL20_15350 [Sphingobium sp.]
MLKILPDLPLVWRLSHISVGDYGLRFRNPLLRSFFCDGTAPKLSALALILSLAWMSGRNAGYAIGGSQARFALGLGSTRFWSRSMPHAAWCLKMAISSGPIG